MSKQVVDRQDGFTIAVASDLFSPASSGAKNHEAQETGKRHAICWEFVGASTTAI